MYALSEYITRPINQLIRSTKRIKEGNFAERVNINTNDEIGILSENFNAIAFTVEDKIFKLEKSVEQKQRFIDNLTHEFKTPLTSIIGYAEFLIATKHNEEVFLLGMNHILNEGKRLKKLWKKMMDLILLKKENFIMKKQSIKKIIFEIKEILELKSKNKDIDLIILGEDYEVFVEKDLSKIFEPYYMVDKSRSKENNGAGIGLCICAEIVKIHRAKIEMESKLKEGTMIRVIFKSITSIS